MSGEYDVVVIGGGLAGLTASLTSGRLGRRTALLTGGVLGGQLVSIDKIEGVPGFPEGVPGYDLCPMTQEQADAAGVECLMAGCEQFTAQGDHWALTSDGSTTYIVGSDGYAVRSSDPMLSTLTPISNGPFSDLWTVQAASNGLVWLAGDSGFLGYLDSRP